MPKPDDDLDPLPLPEPQRRSPTLPRPTRCPSCGCLEATTVCRLCGADKINPPEEE